MSTSGGWLYHWRAFRFRNHEWRNHLDSVHDFLEAWWQSQKSPRSSALILVGPSGGYSLSENFLERFEHIVVYEPDLMARRIFEARFSRLRSRLEWKPEGYDFRSDLPQGSVLFCNLLGQIEMDDWSAFKIALVKQLKGRDWASYHDFLSGENLRFRVPYFQSRKIDAAEVRSWIYSRSSRPLEGVAHLAPDLFEENADLKFFYWEWRLSRNRTHLIEGVYPSKV